MTSSLMYALSDGCIAPRGDRVLVKLDILPERIGSIVLPDKAREVSTVGVVVSCGPGAKTIARGARVMVGRYAGAMIEGHNNLLLVREEDILADITDGDA